jgi:hypothetical protein
MKALEIKVSVKIIDSNSEKNEKKRLTIKDMTRMKLADLEQNVKDLKSSIDKGEIDEYTINTFTTLCGRTIEELNKSFSDEDEEKQKIYVNMMKDILKLEKVDELNESSIKNKNLKGDDINEKKNKEEDEKKNLKKNSDNENEINKKEKSENNEIKNEIKNEINQIKEN